MQFAVPIFLTAAMAIFQVQETEGLAGNGNGILRRPTSATSVADKLVNFCVRHPGACTSKRELSPMHPILRKIILRRQQQQQPADTGRNKVVADLDTGLDGVIRQRSQEELDKTRDVPFFDQKMRDEVDSVEGAKMSSQQSQLYHKFQDAILNELESISDRRASTSDETISNSDKSNVETSMYKEDGNKLRQIEDIEAKLQHFLNLLFGVGKKNSESSSLNTV